LFRDWQRTQTQSSVKAPWAQDSKWMSGSAKAGTTAERQTCELRVLKMFVFARSSVARVRRTVFSLDNDLHGGQPLGKSGSCHKSAVTGNHGPPGVPPGLAANPSPRADAGTACGRIDADNDAHRALFSVRISRARRRIVEHFRKATTRQSGSLPDGRVAGFHAARHLDGIGLRVFPPSGGSYFIQLCYPLGDDFDPPFAPY